MSVSSAFLTVLGCDDDPVGPEGPLVEIVAGAGISDTIGTVPLQGLTARIVGSDGRPEADVDVLFQGLGIAVGPIGGQPGGSVAVSTDSKGRATVQIRLGMKAGDGLVAISVPVYGLADTARYTILPGQPVELVVLPKDTVAFLGDTLTFRSEVRDRLGNPRPHPVTFEAGPGLHVSSEQTVVAVGQGTTTVRAQAEIDGITVEDSSRVAIIPEGEVAYSDFVGLYLSDLTGAQSRTLTGSGAVAPSWSPDAARMVATREDGLVLIDTAGAIEVLSTPQVSNATWPDYSADGAWIYFQGAEDFEQRIYRVRPDGSGLERVQDRTACMPSVSPDGKSLVYVAGENDGPVVVRSLVDGTETTIVDGPAQTPRWAPDGTWIAYVLHGQLSLVRPDGSERRQIGSVHLDPGFSWSPDSRWLLGTALGSGALVDLAPGEVVSLPWAGEYPAWRPVP